ncbi:hypothetical protein BO83DRAFT_441681 [Aspergillus eucalypticola CBS 122712]|uniref:ABC transporter domain-containing protein n=1 Tax=Aspergillus eucalypticola (strain CBS 122712 / IBT 29274) TaxID=1448314 RepID=A0A317UNQ9_ASPEC|nr:uncharacterized protein BO83DRAFT_441681 [Aspergillus eucalypticola CBS 122712]PWY63145.1 hypothetical protein BO83DRAFT_441681 [Aspergillus eucalypticola CBS 122712]
MTGKRKTPTTQIIRDANGVVFSGESMLVLGRPGAGCTTLLKTLANSHGHFWKYRVNWHMLVFRTKRWHIDIGPKFALRLRKPANETRSDSEFAREIADASLSTVGLSHTTDTIVGNAFVRGVSGGERKRVTLIEALSANPAVAAWDNPTRGLDGSSATEFVQFVTSTARDTGMSNIVTMYQVSETIYDCFDWVTVLYDGRTIFCGKTDRAKEYFIRLGFECRDRQTTPNFLTSVTSPADRLIRKDAAGIVPTDPDQLAAAFRESHEYLKLQKEIEAYHIQVGKNSRLIQEFRDNVQQIRSRWAPKLAIAPNPLPKQIWITIFRYYQLLWGDKRTFLTILAFVVLNAVINGPAYYMAPKDETGSYEKSSALFFALIYFYLNALTEVVSTVKSRSILLKQAQYGFLHPSAFVIAQAIADIPISFFQCLVFSCLYYFSIDLQRTASSFWIFVLIVFAHYTAVQSLFRMLGAWVPNISLALMMAGSAIPVGLLYSGFGPTRPTQHRWGSWLRRASPSPYALEALIGNEFTGINLTCSESEMVPYGSSYTELQYQTCSITGSLKAHDSVAGSVYLADHFGYTRDHLWRNFGIVVVLWFLYTVLGSIGLTVMTRESGGSQSRIFKLSKQRDEESLPKSAASSSSATQTVCEDSQTDGMRTEGASDSTFTFTDVSYTVAHDGEDKQLLHKVSGYARPGQLTALMGASGAGKTTLLDTLAQRKRTGKIEGTFRLNSELLDESFERSCGFVMQQDIHEPFATVREALEFSAHSRQPAHISNENKMAYVEHIIHLLDLENIAEALVGQPGDGQLSVEERKRVTIGVELAARPSSLLFLDEPTSGLDSQASFELVLFLRRIAAEGIPVVCTIHQPSGVLFDMFDQVLLLAPGGRTVYFGETGEKSSEVVDYFGRHGAIIGSDTNPAEFILSTLNSSIASKETKINSSQLYASSSQNKYALSLWAQTIAVTKRHWISVWRDGMYNFSKIAKSFFVSMFIAFSFFHAGYTLQGLQSQMIALLLLSWIIPTTCADLQDLWFRKWAIFTAREQNGIYDWRALLTALIVVEIPWQLFTYTLFYLATYWTVGYPNETPVAGLYYFMWILLGIFGTGYSHLLAALFPSANLGGYANSLFWVILMIVSGVLTPHAYLNDFYRPWLFWIDPMRYFFGASLGSVLHGVAVECSSNDLVVFDAPPGSTCGQYTAAFLGSNPGYIVNPSATADCSYCPYSVGDKYLDTLDYSYGQRWCIWAVFVGFCCTNFVLVYVVVWFTKGRGQRRA